MKSIFNNWKTSSLGVGMIVTYAVHIAYTLHSKSLSEPDCVGSIMAILGGVGLLCAGDAGATPPTPNIKKP